MAGAREAADRIKRDLLHREAAWHMQWIQKLNDLRLRTKLTASFILVVLIPVLITGAFLTEEFRQMAIDDAVSQANDNVLRVKQRSAEVLDVAIDVSFRILFDDRLEQLVNGQYESTYDYVTAFRPYQAFTEYSRYYSEIDEIRFYIDNPTMINNWSIVHVDSATAELDWFHQAEKREGLIGWHRVVDAQRKIASRLSLVRRVDFPAYSSYGILTIDINSAELNTILAQETFETMIVDENNIIVAANRTGRIGRELGEIDMRPRHGDEEGTYDIRFEGEPSKIVVAHYLPYSSYNQLRIISVFSLEDLLEEADRIRTYGLVVILLSFLVALILIYGFSLMLSRRLHRLSKQIDQVSYGNLHTSVTVDGKDEIGLLSRKFNTMVFNVRRLMGEVEESNRQKQQLLLKQNEIKLKMMASQINPHFLFNALESVRMKAHMRNEVEIARVVKLLGKLMRKNLEAGGRPITVRDELEMVRCYLEIQTFRYGDRLRYDIQTDRETESMTLPPLIIQPLVENAIIHGIENMEGTGRVKVSTKREESKLYVEVCDDGIGMPPQKVDEIRRYLQEEQETGMRIGLRNVFQRLQLTYQERFTFDIRSLPNQGTCIRITIPAGGKSDVSRHDRR